MSIDLATKTGVLRFCELRRAEMVSCFEQLGRYERNGFSFDGFVFATFEPIIFDGGLRSGKKLPAVEACHTVLPAAALTVLDPSEHTLVFGRMVSAFAKCAHAVGTLIMSEAWLADEPPEDREYGWVGKAPSRREALFMRLEHKAVGAISWVAFISREPTRVEPWRASAPGTGAASGDGTRLGNTVDWKD